MSGIGSKFTTKTPNDVIDLSMSLLLISNNFHSLILNKKIPHLIMNPRFFHCFSMSIIQDKQEFIRGSHQKCSVKLVFLEISHNSHENTFARVSFLIKLQALWHRCLFMNFAKFLRTPFFIEHLWWLLLYEIIVWHGKMMSIFTFSMILAILVPIPTKRKNEVKFLFSHFFVVPQNVL